jgi:hypothetical protein
MAAGGAARCRRGVCGVRRGPLTAAAAGTAGAAAARAVGAPGGLRGGAAGLLRRGRGPEAEESVRGCKRAPQRRASGGLAPGRAKGDLVWARRGVFGRFRGRGLFGGRSSLVWRAGGRQRPTCCSAPAPPGPRTRPRRRRTLPPRCRLPSSPASPAHSPSAAQPTAARLVRPRSLHAHRPGKRRVGGNATRRRSWRRAAPPTTRPWDGASQPTRLRRFPPPRRFPGPLEARGGGGGVGGRRRRRPRGRRRAHPRHGLEGACGAERAGA